MIAINLRHPLPAHIGIAAAAVIPALYVTGTLKQIQDTVARIFKPSSFTVHVQDEFRSKCTPRGYNPSIGYVAEDKTMTCNERLNLAIRNIEACPEAKKLLDTLDSNDPVCFLCVPNQGAPRGAKTWMHNRTIVFSNDRIQQDPGTTLLVYELKNAEQEREFLDTIRDAANGLSDKHKFIYEIESLEYLSALGHYEIATACKKSSEWPDEIVDAFAYAAKNSFPTAAERDMDHWKKTSKTATYIKPSDSITKIFTLMVNEKSGHSEMVGRTFDEIQIHSKKT